MRVQLALVLEAQTALSAHEWQRRVDLLHVGLHALLVGHDRVAEPHLGRRCAVAEARGWLLLLLELVLLHGAVAHVAGHLALRRLRGLALRQSLELLQDGHNSRRIRGSRRIVRDLRLHLALRVHHSGALGRRSLLLALEQLH